MQDFQGDAGEQCTARSKIPMLLLSREHPMFLKADNQPLHQIRHTPEFGSCLPSDRNQQQVQSSKALANTAAGTGHLVRGSLKHREKLPA